MAQPLSGIRVVDFSHVVAGPLATHFLALLGADVIKVEPPHGDGLRNYTLDPSQRGMAPAFLGINLAKRSIVLDLKTDEGKTAARRLVEGADVVVENFRPGVMARHGLDAVTARAGNPGLVYCSVSGFGQEGPLRDFPAIDQIIQSVSGLMGLSGREGDDAMRIGIPIVDTFSGLLAAFAIQTALVQRERNGGEGQVIDVAMLDATLVMMVSVVNPYLIAGEKPVRTGNRGFSRQPTADTFHTARGQITIGAVEQAQVERLLEVLGLDALACDPRFTDRDTRVANADAMAAALQSAFLAREADAWVELLNAARIPAGKVASLEEALGSPQLAHRGLTLDVQQSDGTRYTALNAGFQFATNGPTAKSGAPRLGEHSQEIMAEIGMRPVSPRRGSAVG